MSKVTIENARMPEDAKTIGRTRAANPAARRRFAALLPKILPIIILECPFLAKIREELSSGSEVVTAIIIRPKKDRGMLKSSAINDQPTANHNCKNGNGRENNICLYLTSVDHTSRVYIFFM